MILKQLRAIFSLIYFLLFFSCQSAEQENVVPNVLMISIDDLNDWVGILKANPDVKTPNIDRLGQGGIIVYQCSLSGAYLRPFTCICALRTKTLFNRYIWSDQRPQS